MSLLTKNIHKRRWFRIWENIHDGCRGRAYKLQKHHSDELSELSHKVGPGPVLRNHDYDEVLVKWMGV